MRVASVQATPVFLDRDATINDARDLIAEAVRNGVRLAVFPESFVPVHPTGHSFLPRLRVNFETKQTISGVSTGGLK